MDSYPRLTVLRIINGPPDATIPDGLRRWIEKQTCARQLLGLVWDQASGRVRSLDGPAADSDAPSAPGILRRLTTEYLCLADDDLLIQSETYLEENLVALETGRLAFTVNTRGDVEWAAQCIRRGLFPGRHGHPLMRHVVRTECVNSQFTIDLTRWMAARRGRPTVVGRILRHLARDVDSPETVRCDATIECPAVQFAVDGTYVVARTVHDGDWTPKFGKPLPVEPVLSLDRGEHGLPVVIMIHTYLAVGGAERIHLNLMRELAGQIQFVVVGVEPLDAALGTTADEFRELTPYVYSMADFLHPSMFLSFLCGLIDRFRPDALYVANGANFVYDWLPTIRHLHPTLRMSNQVYDHKIGWINRYNQTIVASLDAHIGVNRNICQAYVEKGAPHADVFLIENGIIRREFDSAAYDPQRIASIRERLGLPSGPSVVTFAARFHEQKRPGDFVDMAELAKHDPSLLFLMVGDGPLAGAIDTRLRERELHNVIRQPFYQPMSDIFAATDVYVLPSSFEGMPMVLLEAQAMGKPVVATDVGNNRELLETTGGGIVIEHIGDVPALLAAVRHMIDRQPDPETLSQAILSRYDIAIVAQRYRQVLLGLGQPDSNHA